MDSSDADSQTDMFANTQAPPETNHIRDSQPDQWGDTNFEYPWIVLFKWNGSINPFKLLPLTEVDPRDIDNKWLSYLLSPASRCKHRNLTKFPDYAVSLFGKVHKSKFKINFICIFAANSNYVYFSFKMKKPEWTKQTKVWSC